MNEKEQQEFFQWLAQQLQATSQEDFEAKVQQLGEEGLKKAYAAWKQSKQKAKKALGGTLEYMRALKNVPSFKKGGCSCKKSAKKGTKIVQEFKSRKSKCKK